MNSPQRTATQLHDFVCESNCIEGIQAVADYEIAAHERLLGLSAEEMTVEELERFVRDVAARPLRDKPGMNVIVGNHRPLPGGPQIRLNLECLLADIAHPYMASETTPYEAHVQYEQLHPFMDGNGRSGRALWAWMMQREGLDPFALPFLHRFYYQALDASR